MINDINELLLFVLCSFSSLRSLGCVGHRHKPLPQKEMEGTRGRLHTFLALKV